MKKTLIYSLMMLCQMALALPLTAEAAKPGVLKKVTGTVSFEQRSGMMPMTMMSTSYWSVVIHGTDTDYELSDVFGMDHDVQPASTEIGKAVVHPGDQVVVEGRIQKIRKNFGLLSEVKNIKVVHNDTPTNR